MWNGKPEKDIKSQDIYIPEPCMYLFREQEQQKKFWHEKEIKVDKNVEPERLFS